MRFFNFCSAKHIFVLFNYFSFVSPKKEKLEKNLSEKTTIINIGTISGFSSIISFKKSTREKKLMKNESKAGDNNK